MAHGIPEMLGLVQEIFVDLCYVCNLKNRDMKKEESVMIAGICFAAIVLMVALAVILL